MLSDKFLRAKVEVLQDPACIRLMEDFIKARPELWNEDIGI
jgi:cytosine deaminase